jgi:nucleoid DNA-binding protein
MKRDELNEAIMRAAGLTKANVNRFYAGLSELIKKRLVSEGEFVLPGVGVLVVRTRAARTGRNPRTGQTLRIPRRKAVRFRAYRDLRAALNPAWVAADDTSAPDAPGSEG